MFVYSLWGGLSIIGVAIMGLVLWALVSRR